MQVESKNYFREHTKRDKKRCKQDLKGKALWNNKKKVGAKNKLHNEEVFCWNKYEKEVPNIQSTDLAVITVEDDSDKDWRKLYTCQKS